MRRPFAVLLLTSILTSGCASRHGKIAAGAVMAVTGMAIAGSPNTTTTREDWFGGTYRDEDHSNDVLGGLLAVSGAVLVLAGLATRDEDDTRTVMMVPQPYAYTPVYVPAPEPAPEPEPPHPTTVIDAPNAQTVIVTDTVIVQQAP